MMRFDSLINVECISIESVVKILNKMSDFHDTNTKDHSKKVSVIAFKIGQYIGMTGDELRHLTYGADIHDIGKLAIDPLILRQSSKLTPGQYASIRKHPEFGLEMIKYAEFPKVIKECILYHHEHWDGSGYPFGLTGSNIPLWSCVVTVSDVWESLNSDRPFRMALSRDKALETMKVYHRWFCPEVYVALLALIGKGDV